MNSSRIVANSDFRMKVINCLKNYGEYDGVLAKNDISKSYVNGDVKLIEVIKSKWEYKLLKAGINNVLDYCYEKGFREIEDFMKYFYKVECLEIRKLYGSFFEKLGRR